MIDIEKLQAGAADPQRTSFEDLGEKRLDLAANLAVRTVISDRLKKIAASDPHERSADVDSEAIRTESWQKELGNGSAAGACIEMAAGQIGERKNDN